MKGSIGSKMKNLKIMKQSVLLKILLSTVFVFFAFELSLKMIGESISTIAPSWNDEAFYYSQVKSVLAYGHSLGYYGYNYSHSNIGGFGFHGMFILIPYWLMGKIIGLDLNTIAITNIVLIIICFAVFICLFNPTIKQYLLLFVSLFSGYFFFLSVTEMVDTTNYFYALLISFFFLKMINCDGKNKKKETIYRILLATCITIACLSKPVFVAFWLPFVLVFFCRGKQVWKCGITGLFVSILATLIMSVLFYVIFAQFSSPYFTSQIDSVKAVFLTQGIWNGLVHWLRLFLVNARLMITDGLFGDNYTIVIPSWVELVTIIVSIGVCIRYKFANYAWVPSLVILEFLIGSNMLYAGGGFSIRTAYPAIVFATSFVVNMYYEKMHVISKRLFVVAFTTFCICTLYCYASNQFDARSYNSDKLIEETKYVESELSRVIILDANTDNPWENTIAQYGAGAFASCVEWYAYPAGVGINLIMPGCLNNSSKYVMISESEVELSYDVENLGYKYLKTIHGYMYYTR